MKFPILEVGKEEDPLRVIAKALQEKSFFLSIYSWFVKTSFPDL
jgi:hypothetical protein